MATSSLRQRLASGVDLASLHFLAVAANAANFGGAANILGLNPSTVSRRIARLEDALGVTLFERGRFGIRLTEAGKEVIVHVHRMFDDLDAAVQAGERKAAGLAGRVRLGVRMPPIGHPLQGLLATWHIFAPEVTLGLFEMNDNEIRLALAERRLDAAFVARPTIWKEAVVAPIYRERILAAVPLGHRLCCCDTLTWNTLRSEPILTQEWEGSHAGREFYASILGSGVQFVAHAASKQSVLALVAAGFGVTLVTASQATACFPGVIFKPVHEPDAWINVDLTWHPAAEDPVVGRFIAFMRDQALSRRLF